MLNVFDLIPKNVRELLNIDKVVSDDTVKEVEAENQLNELDSEVTPNLQESLDALLQENERLTSENTALTIERDSITERLHDLQTKYEANISEFKQTLLDIDTGVTERFKDLEAKISELSKTNALLIAKSTHSKFDSPKTENKLEAASNSTLGVNKNPRAARFY